MQGLTEGRIVHFVLEGGHAPGEHRPAIIVKVINRLDLEPVVNLQVFTDGSDGPRYADCPYWATSIQYSEEKRPGTWHWIEPA